MPEKKLIIKEKNISKARQNLLKNIPKGYFLISLKEYKPIKNFTDPFYGISIEDAYLKALEKIPKELRESAEKVVIRKPMKQSLKIEAKNIENARTAIQSKIENTLNQEHPESVEIIKIELFEKGKKKFGGLFKDRDMFECFIHQKAVVKIEYHTNSTIIAEITDDKETANESLIENAGKGEKFITSTLINQGADINYCDIEGRNSLLHSVSKGYSELALDLIEKGIDVHKKDQYGKNALNISNILQSTKKNDRRLVTILIEKGVEKPKAETNHKTKITNNFCPKCKKNVQTYEESYDYDNGAFRRTIIKCKLCDSDIDDEVEQN